MTPSPTPSEGEAMLAYHRIFSPLKCVFYNFIGWYPRVDSTGRIYVWMRIKDGSASPDTPREGER